MVNWRLSIVSWLVVISAAMVLALSPAALSAQSAQSWYEQLLQKGFAEGSFMHQILIVKELKDGHIVCRDIDADKFETGSFFELMEGRETEYRYLLNQRSEAIQDYNPSAQDEEKTLAEVFRFTHADTIILAPENGERWSIFRRDLKTGAKRDFMVKGPAEAQPEEIKKWLLEKIGYSGIVLDQNDKFLLVALYRELAEGASAMIVKSSHELLRIKKSQMAGSALLTRRDCHKSVCVFEILIEETKNQYPAGSKVFF